MPKTKIICTIGPSSSTPEKIRELIVAGMNVARLNFSHGSQAEHLEKIHLIRKISKELKRPVAILQDLCGPKIRIGCIKGKGIELRPGQTFILTGEAVEGDEKRVSVSHPQLPGEVRPGDTIMMADGLLALRVCSTTPSEITCEVITGGRLTSHKGINLPTRSISVSSITQKDIVDLKFGIHNDIDFVALSFVTSARDIIQAKAIMEIEGRSVPVIAKIEKHEALESLDAIMAESDAIMVARGDLGVEIPLENVPGIQKMIIRKANRAGKPVIIATQMLKSMVDSLLPTRAEAIDVANAMQEGADAVMLSEETAIGHYPVESVRFMARILKKAEEEFPYHRYTDGPATRHISEAVARSACHIADQLCAMAVVATTVSGYTALQLARFKPKTPIIALSPHPETIRQLTIVWGCKPFLSSSDKTICMTVKEILSAEEDSKTTSSENIIVITEGEKIYEKGSTSMIKVKYL